MSKDSFPFAEARTFAIVGNRRRLRNSLLMFLALCLPLVWACTPPLLVRHRSKVRRTIHVYINWKVRCRVEPGDTCSLDLPPGRYYFYALVPGLQQYKWASRANPVPFAVDKGTVIDLHDPKPKPYKANGSKAKKPENFTGNIDFSKR